MCDQWINLKNGYHFFCLQSLLKVDLPIEMLGFGFLTDTDVAGAATFFSYPCLLL